MKTYLLLLITALSFTFTNCSSLFEQDEYQDCAGFLYDSTGKYTRVKIGDQCWLKEDIQVRTDFAGKITPYGVKDDVLFYNISAANNRNMCPLGYQLPSTDEWLKLGTQVTLLDGMGKGYLVDKVEVFLSKNSITRLSTRRLVEEGRAGFWLVRNEVNTLATFNGTEGLKIQYKPVLINDVRELPEMSTIETGYFSVKCIRIENF
jgi:uncharacterized protein (TIGR02145 family)